MKKDTGAKREKAKKFYSLALSVCTTMVKLIAGALTASVFVVVSGFYSCFAGVAKALCYKGSGEIAEKKRAQIYLAVACMTGAAALLYLAGVIRQFFVPLSFGYGLIPAIALAAVSFYDLGAAIAGLVKAFKEKDGFRVALKRINLSGALAAIALTQVAILSVTSGSGNYAADAAMGVAAGAVMTLSSAMTLAKGLKAMKEAKSKSDKD